MLQPPEKTHEPLSPTRRHMAICAVLVLAPTMFAQQSRPDNTKTNAGDLAQSQPTADQQKNNRPDLKITRAIRRAIVADKSLSTSTHNVKIITQHGTVTLKGSVSGRR